MSSFKYRFKTIFVHYSGAWMQARRGGELFYKYQGGQVIDSGVWDGDEVSMLDMNMWGIKQVPGPGGGSIVWYYLQNTIRKEIDTDAQLMEMWHNLKPDSGGFTHLYADYVIQKPIRVEHPENRSENDDEVPPRDQYHQMDPDSGYYSSDSSSWNGDEPSDKDEESSEEPSDFYEQEDSEDSDDDEDEEEEDDADYDEEEEEETGTNPMGERESMKKKKKMKKCGEVSSKEKVDQMKFKSVNAEDEESDNRVPEHGEELDVGQCFHDIYECRNYLRLHAVRLRFEIVMKRNDSDRVEAVCRVPECPWRCYVSRTNDKHTMKVRRIEKKHTCKADCHERNRCADARFIATKIEELMRLHHRSFTPKDIRAEMWKHYQIKIKYWQAWHARCIALERVHGNYAASYLKVPELCKQILISNPGSVATWSRDSQFKNFTHCCISFKACVEGFVKGCRPFIGLDGCFLKGQFGGVLLIMVALDGNNGIVPLAFYVASSENFESWKKFLEIMRPHVERHEHKLTIISDRQKGLIPAIQQVFPNCNQRNCFRHMYKNMQRKHRGLEKLAWGAARAFRKSDFTRFMEEIEKGDEGAKNYLMQENPSLWARSHFDVVCKADHNTSNFVEAWNGLIVEAREKPVIHLLVEMQTIVMQWFFDRRELAEGWHDDELVPRVVAEIEKKKKRVREYKLGGATQDIWQVIHSYGSMATVKLVERECSCLEWQITGIPCVHAICVLEHKRANYSNYCSHYFLNRSYKATYSDAICPITPEEDWEKPSECILPPQRLRRPGRPRVNRTRGDDETVKGHNQCAKCKEYGHNSRTCQGGPVGGNQSARARGRGRGGRPRNNPEMPNPLQLTLHPTDMSNTPPTGRGRGRGRVVEGERAVGRGRGRGRVVEGETSMGRGRGRVVGRRGRGRDVGGERAVGRGRGRGRDVGGERAESYMTHGNPSTSAQSTYQQDTYQQDTYQQDPDPVYNMTFQELLFGFSSQASSSTPNNNP